MKITVILNKGNNPARLAKLLWKHRGVYRDPTRNVPPAIEKLGVEILDPLDEFQPVREKFEPPAGDIRFMEEPNITEHPDYNEEPALLYTYSTKLLYRTKQVCILTKSQAFKGLPDNVSKLVGKVAVPNKEALLQQYILHSQEWNSTYIKLPHRFDKENLSYKFAREYGIPRNKSMSILLTDLIYLCQSTAAQFPGAITDRSLRHKPYIDTYYNYKGKHIIIKSALSYLLGSKHDLQPFVNEEFIDSSIHYTLPDLFPAHPLIDLQKQHLYTNTINPGFKPPYAFNKPHTIFYINTDFWKSEERHSRSLMMCFAYAMTRAKERFGEDILNLPEPICVQCVDMNQNTLNFTCFQLNTLNLDKDDGIKNFVWFDAGNRLFTKHLPQPWKKEEDEKYLKTRYTDFDPKPFDKMLALVLNGLSVL